MPLLRFVRPMHTVAVDLAGHHVGQIGVPHQIGVLLELDALAFVLVVWVLEQAELYLRGTFGKQREVHARSVPGGSEGIRLTWPNAHWGSPYIAGKAALSHGFPTV